MPVLRYRAMVCGVAAPGLAALDESVAILQSMVAANPQNFREISTLAGMYEGRGDAHMHLLEGRVAAADYAKACEWYERARSTDPGDAGDEVLAAECHTRLGRALLMQGRAEAAAEAYRQALVLLRPLLTIANPDVEAEYLLAD